MKGSSTNNDTPAQQQGGDGAEGGPVSSIADMF